MTKIKISDINHNALTISTIEVVKLPLIQSHEPVLKFSLKVLLPM